MRLLRRFDEGTVATLLMAGMLLVMSAQVTSRYVFNSPLAWTEEALRYIAICMSGWSSWAAALHSAIGDTSR